MSNAHPLPRSRAEETYGGASSYSESKHAAPIQRKHLLMNLLRQPSFRATLCPPAAISSTSVQGAEAGYRSASWRAKTAAA
jgi:hypothetical protein